jgi:hypothetical protein
MEPANLYYYFDSKEQLVESVVRLGLQYARENVQKAIEKIDVELPAERLRVALFTFTHELHGEEDFTSAAVRSLGQLPAHLRERCHSQNMDFGEFWDGLFAAACEGGVLRDDIDARLARHLVLSAVIVAVRIKSPRRSGQRSSLACWGIQRRGPWSDVLLGDFINGGRKWERKANPERVGVRDFPGEDGKAILWSLRRGCERRLRAGGRRSQHRSVRGPVGTTVVADHGPTRMLIPW